MHDQSSPQSKNHLLAALPRADYDRLAPHLELVKSDINHYFYHAGEQMKYAYFPLGMMISLVSKMADGGSVEVGVIGFEGMAGLPLVLGVEQSPHETMVQLPDSAMRIEAKVLQKEFKRGGALHDLLLRYAQGVITHTSQIAACNRMHLVEERLARWLLMCHDRYRSDKLPLTQEFLAMMLGCRRVGVTAAALNLQTQGYINYKRGHITIIDRPGLEDFACDCYRVVKAEFDRLTV
ncbi:MAG: Crp/Fnr family transcriptional regulator [Pyrinomonadaceae bacterium]